jgi:hypothetical protein
MNKNLDAERLANLVTVMKQKELEWADTERQIAAEIRKIQNRSPHIKVPGVLEDILEKIKNSGLTHAL